VAVRDGFADHFLSPAAQFTILPVATASGLSPDQSQPLVRLHHKQNKHSPGRSAHHKALCRQRC
jgi:hypothetical protein